MRQNPIMTVLAILLVLNIAAIDTYLYFQFVRGDGGDPAPSASQRNADALTNLDEGQRSRLAESMDEFRRATGELNGRIRVLDDGIFAMLQRDAVPTDSIRMNLEEIGALKLRIKELAIEQLIRTKAYLSKEQQRRLFGAIFRSETAEKRPGLNVADAPRPGPGAGKAARLAKLLSLTSEQSDRVARIVDEARTALMAARDDDARKALKDEEDRKISDVLTAEQRARFEEWKRSGRREDRPPKESPPSQNQPLEERP